MKPQYITVAKPNNIRSFEPTESMVEVMRDFKDVLLKHAELHPSILLALASQLVGNLSAMQAPEYTKHMILTIVEQNITAGNRAYVDPLENTEGEA